MREAINIVNDLFESDPFSWTEQQIKLLREKKFDQLDYPNLLLHLEEMARSDQREVKRRFRELLMHMLKIVVQPEKHTDSWNQSIAKQKADLQLLIQDNPGLKQYIPPLYDDAFKLAVLQAAEETYLPIDHFPNINPLPTWEDALEYAAPVPPTPPLRPVRKPKGKIARKRKGQ